MSGLQVASCRLHVFFSNQQLLLATCHLPLATNYPITQLLNYPATYVNDS